MHPRDRSIARARFGPGHRDMLSQRVLGAPYHWLRAPPIFGFIISRARPRHAGGLRSRAAACTAIHCVPVLPYPPAAGRAGGKRAKKTRAPFERRIAPLTVFNKPGAALYEALHKGTMQKHCT